MADDALKVTIKPGLAERLTRAAEAAGESVDAFVNGLLDTHAIGPTDWTEVDRICDGAAETGIPWEQFEPRLRNLGRRQPPRRPARAGHSLRVSRLPRAVPGRA